MTVVRCVAGCESKYPLVQRRAFAGSRLRELPGGAQRRICKLDCRMTELADMIRIGIVNGDVARIQNGRGVMLSVQHGTVWITQTDSVADVFLNAGESFRLDRDGRTLVSPCGPEPLALVTLASSSRTAPLAKRVAAGLRRMWTGLRRVPWRASLN